jgi:hypothetical protein
MLTVQNVIVVSNFLVSKIVYSDGETLPINYLHFLSVESFFPRNKIGDVFIIDLE